MRRVVTVFKGLAGLVLLLIPIVVMWLNWPITVAQRTPALAMHPAIRIPLPSGATVQTANETIVELQNPQQLHGAKASLGPLNHSYLLGQPSVNGQPLEATTSTCAQTIGSNTGCTAWVVSEANVNDADPEIDGNAAGVYLFNPTQPNVLEKMGLRFILMDDHRVSSGSGLLVGMYITYIAALATLWLGIRAEYNATAGERVSKAGHR